jgi:hypothetical protein
MHDRLRQLLGDHALQTANVVAALGAGREPDPKLLLLNAQELGALLGHGYGVSPQRFVELLIEHANGTVMLLGYLRRNDPFRAAAIERSWEHNGEDLVRAFLDADPALNRGEIRRLVREHLDLVRAQANAFFRGDKDTAFANYQRDNDVLLVLGDLLVEDETGPDAVATA